MCVAEEETAARAQALAAGASLVERAAGVLASAAAARPHRAAPPPHARAHVQVYVTLPTAAPSTNTFDTPHGYTHIHP